MSREVCINASRMKMTIKIFLLIATLLGSLLVSRQASAAGRTDLAMLVAQKEEDGCEPPDDDDNNPE